MRLPRLYPIVDLDCLASAADPVASASRFAEALLEGGATLLQLRDKSSEVRRFLSCARELRRITQGRATLIINDRADLCLAVNADGVHLGQDDLSPESVRRIFESVDEVDRVDEVDKEARGHAVGQSQGNVGQVLSTPSAKSTSSTKSTRERLIIGFSTHNLEQVRLADSMPVDYIAVGPVFATASKARPDPVIGVEGVRRARAATTKPLVAIGGISRRNCREVIDAGADSVAVIADLLGSPVKAVEEFLRVLR